MLRWMPTAILVAAVCLPCRSRAEPLINEYVASNQMGIVDEDGEHADWIELANTGPASVNLDGYSLSDDLGDPFKWIFPDRELLPGEHLLIFASGKDRTGSELHTNFKLDAAGEILSLHDRHGELIDSIETGRMRTEHSRGRDPGGGGWVYYVNPTPGVMNGDEGRPGYASTPIASVDAGIFDGSLMIELHPGRFPTAGVPEIRFTLDGSDPTSSSPVHIDPVHIETTATLRATAFGQDLHPSKILTHTYIINEPCDLPVVSVVTDPDNLWDPETGIYALGDDAQTEFPFYGANFWNDWERPAHIEHFGADGGLRFELDAGLRIHGGISRALDQKSFRIMARGGYGTDRIECTIFPDKDVDSFKRIILRNAAADFLKGQIRDALQHRLASRFGLPRQGYQPARLYLNGHYWGMVNIRERIDRYFLESNYGADPENIDLLRNLDEVKEGDRDDYDDLLSYIEQHDMSDDAQFTAVAERIDTENFCTYYIFRIFAASRDWPRNNCVYWRSREEGAKWRWILLDTEWGLSLVGATPERETLTLLLNPDHPENRNPPEATFIFRELLLNQGFRNEFINRFADYLNTDLLPESTLVLTRDLAGAIEAEIPRHMDRWGGEVDVWHEEIASIEDFFARRPALMRTNLQREFDLGETLTLSLNVVPQGGGSIGLTAATVDGPWSGIYFQDLPISLTAKPAPGFSFVSWSIPELPKAESIKIRPETDVSLTALFQGDTSQSVWHSVRPNPFHSDAAIWFMLDRESKVSVTISDLSGRRVREVIPANIPAGLRSIEWDGLDESGRPVPSGVYYYVLSIDSSQTTGPMVLVR